MEEIVSYRTDLPIAFITLNRPEKRNALSAALTGKVRDALAEAAANDGVRAVVLTGAGSAFSAGADLQELGRLVDVPAEEHDRDARRLAALFAEIYLHPKTVIARVNGHAIGGGCGLVAACDFAVACQDARLGFTEVRLGFVPAIVSVFVLRKIGEAAARNLLLRGRLISAAEAMSLGLVTTAVPSADLDYEVARLADELASEPSPSAVALTKRTLAHVRGMGLEEALSYASQVNAFARGTTDCRAGVEAFLNKTDPPWKNQ